MEQSFLAKILAKLSLAIIGVALLDLVYLNYLVIGNRNEGASTRPVNTDTATVAQDSPSPSSSPNPSPSGQTSSGETKTVVEKETVVEKQTQTIVQTAQKEIFIPMGAGSTKSREYADLTSTDVTIDTSKYANIQLIVFEASIRVEGGNGAAYAQLYNVSDKVGYWETEMKTSSGTSVSKTSPNVSLPNGEKTYRVRAKTDLVEFPAYVENARIKITLK